MIASVAGAVVSPRPVPSNTICIAITAVRGARVDGGCPGQPGCKHGQTGAATAVVPILWTTARSNHAGQCDRHCRPVTVAHQL